MNGVGRPRHLPPDGDHNHEVHTFTIIHAAAWFSIVIMSGVGCSVAWCWACKKRSEVLQAAASGQPVAPPDGCCLLFCCGGPAIYVWEGCSPSFFITCCFWAWFPLCCWNKTPYPLDNGIMVGAPSHVGVVGSVVTVPGQPPAVIGQGPGVVQAAAVSVADPERRPEGKPVAADDTLGSMTTPDWDNEIRFAQLEARV